MRRVSMGSGSYSVSVAFSYSYGDDMLTIKVLGPGCQNCDKVEEITKSAVSTMGIETHIEKITDINEIVEYGVLSTPGLVINGKVVC